MIGTGASAVQIVPSIAREVERLDVYQRTPIWVSPKFDPQIPGWMKTVFARVPSRSGHARGRQRPVEFISSSWSSTSATCSSSCASRGRNQALPRGAVKDPELRRKLTPEYGMGCKRPCVSNYYLRAFNRDNVELVTEPIERVTPQRHPRRDGTERELDADLLATGFRLSSDPENLPPHAGPRP